MSDQTQEVMQTLFNSLCNNMVEKLASGEATAQDLNVVRQFLKDNNISAVASRGSPIANVLEAFPFQDEQDDNTGRHAKVEKFS